MIYRNSWLPVSNSLVGKEALIILPITLIIIMFYLKFTDLVKYKISNNYYLIILFFLIGISTVFYNVQEITDSVKLFRGFTFISYFIIYFIIIPKLFVNNYNYFLFFLKIFSVLSIIFAVISFIILFTGIGPIENYQNTGYSLLVHPNYVPPIYVNGLLCTLYLFIINKEKYSFYQRYFSIISMFLQFFALLYTFSRNGIISGILGLGIMILIIYRRQFIYIFPVLITVIPVFILAFIKAKGFSSFFSRLYLLIPAFEMMNASKERLLWGYGTTNTFSEFRKYLDVQGVEQNVMIQNPHSSYVSMILMFGLIFSIILIIFWTKIIISGIVNVKKTTNMNKYFYGFLISISLSNLLLGLFESQLMMVEFLNIQPALIFMGYLYYLNKKKILNITEY